MKGYSTFALPALAVALLLTPSAARPATPQRFTAAVIATNPIAYYTLQATHGKSEVGTTSYTSQGGVFIAAPGAPVRQNNHCLKLNGTDGMITTTQVGGIGSSGSIMAWVNLQELPSKADHYFYVAGESNTGNDFDVQFETDDALRFYTASGAHTEFKPASNTLLNHWHMIVVTFDAAGRRAIFWDGKLAAMDAEGGTPNKTTAFTIGASTVFSGRWFRGCIDDVALWNKVLNSGEVSALYRAR